MTICFIVGMICLVVGGFFIANHGINPYQDSINVSLQLGIMFLIAAGVNLGYDLITETMKSLKQRRRANV